MTAFKYSWKGLERAVFEDRAAVLRLPYWYCCPCFAMGEYWARSGRWSLKRLFLAFGVSTSDPDSNLCRCGMSLNVWHFTNLKTAKLRGFCLVFLFFFFFLNVHWKNCCWTESLHAVFQPQADFYGWVIKPWKWGFIMENAT